MRKPLRFTWRSYTLFRLFGVPVQVHSTWFVFPSGLLLLSSAFANGPWGLLFGILFLAMLVFSLLVHEFAHVLVARKHGCKTRRVLLMPVGAVAELEEIPMELGELRVAAAGPIASFALAALAFLASNVVDGPWQTLAWRVDVIFVVFAVVNLTMACFNLLPCFPMDGGRILRATLAIAIRRLAPHRAPTALLIATRIAVRYVARTILIAITLLTIFYTHLWHHILLVALLVLVGEAEYWHLRETSRSHCGQLRTLPFAEGSPRSRRLAHYPLTITPPWASAEACMPGLRRSSPIGRGRARAKV